MDHPVEPHGVVALDLPLEDFVDKHELYRVLEALSRIAVEKAEHLRHAWQDHVAAERWSLMARALDSLSTTAEAL